MSLSETAPPIPEETLHIQNFAGITDATISLSRMNVFIGPQASGKSVCAKLIDFYGKIESRLTRHFFVGEVRGKLSQAVQLARVN